VIRVVGPYLYVGSFRADEPVQRFGTPLYVYDLEVVEENYRRLVSSFPYGDLEVLYSCKLAVTWTYLRSLGTSVQGSTRYPLRRSY